MAKERYTCIRNAPQTLYVTARDETIVHISTKKPPAIGTQRQDKLPLLTDAVIQLTRYFDGKDTVLTFPIPNDQPPFIRKVYALVAAVPYGKTRTAAQIAQDLGDPQAIVGVQMLCRFTPLKVRIPVHRILGVYANENDDTFGAALRQMEQRYC